MKIKMLVMLLLQFVFSNLFSQHISYSDTSWKSKFQMFVLGSCEKGVYVLTARKGDDRWKDVSYNLFDSNLKKINSVYQKYYDESNMIPVKTAIINNELNILYLTLVGWEEKDKSKRGYYLKMYQPFTKKWITIHHFDPADKSINPYYFPYRLRVLYNKDKNCLFFLDYQSSSALVSNAKEINCWTFDKDFNVKRVSLPVAIPDYGKKFETEPAYYFEGNYFFVQYNKSPKEHIHFVPAIEYVPGILDGGKVDFIDLSNDQLSSTEILSGEGSHFLAGTYSVENGKIIYSGLLTKENEKGEFPFSTGTFKYVIKPSGVIEENKIVPSQRPEQIQINEYSQKVSYHFSGREKIFTSNSDFYLTEGINVPKISNGDGIVCYNTGELPKSNEGYLPALIYQDILVLCVDKTGDYKWLKLFERNDKVKAFSRTLDWGSSIAYNDGQSIHILYSEDGTRITHCSIDENGNVNKNNLPIEGITIYPSLGVKLVSGGITMPYEKDGQLGLLKITF